MIVIAYDEDKVAEALSEETPLALDDERRVKTLSPTALVIRRFLRNKLAIIGAVTIIFMALFAFLGGAVMPYGESQVFTKYEDTSKEFAYATKTAEYQAFPASETELPLTLKGKAIGTILAKQQSFTYEDAQYTLNPVGQNVTIDGAYELLVLSEIAQILSVGGKTSVTSADGLDLPADVRDAATKAFEAGQTAFIIGDVNYSLVKSGKSSKLYSEQALALVTKLSYTVLDGGFTLDYSTRLAFEKAIADGTVSFDGYLIDNDNDENYTVSRDGQDLFLASTLSIIPRSSDTVISGDLRREISDAIVDGKTAFVADDVEYTILKGDLATGSYVVRSAQSTELVMVFGRPSPEHWLGTDGSGMDILTRLMYGGRVSLMIGFVAIIIENLIGIILGGISGFFGGFLDMLIMRLVDIFNCIPMMPLYIILGTAMDASKVDPAIRIYVLMVILGVFGWTGTARLVRGQILSLREQEFMIAAEASGIRPSRRIFRHLVPNVTPQLIVLATMGLGGVILLESTLSFLGLGVKFPQASWGSIIYAVNDIHVMTEYLFAWIPAGLCILITVLGFNFIGDGLRDAFDPKMKR